jgi:hypothetical protein
MQVHALYFSDVWTANLNVAFFDRDVIGGFRPVCASAPLVYEKESK